jgi:hypothetical protein
MATTQRARLQAHQVLVLLTPGAFFPEDTPTPSLSPIPLSRVRVGRKH